MLEDDQATFIGFIGVALLLAAFLLNLFRLLRSDGHVTITHLAQTILREWLRVKLGR